DGVGYDKLVLGGYFGQTFAAYSDIKIQPTIAHFVCPSDSVNADQQNVTGGTSYYALWVLFNGIGPIDRIDASKIKARAIVGRDNPGAAIIGDCVPAQKTYYPANWSELVNSQAGNHPKLVNAGYLGGQVASKQIRNETDFAAAPGSYMTGVDQIEYY
ncbi:MAG: hypothetical protein IKA65_10550, partial [Lentisphaeria bacterium]|nr:hypothetical protein [Lentisphaeria bacterium]